MDQEVIQILTCTHVYGPTQRERGIDGVIYTCIYMYFN